MMVRNFKAITGPHVVPLREQGIVHVLGRNLVSEAADSNGSSKTALMVSAPCWCFTGRTEEKRRVVGGAAVRNRWTKESVLVEFEYEDKGERYVLRRERTAGNIETVKLTGPHGRVWDAKHEIEQRLGFDWSFFTNVVVFGPDTSARFSQAVDADRKAVFDQIIPDLERVNRVHERADAVLKNLIHQAEVSEQQVQQLESRLDEARQHSRVLEEQSSQVDALEFDRWIGIMRSQKVLRKEREDVYEEIAAALLRSGRLRAIEPQLEQFMGIVRKLRDAERKLTELGAVVMTLSSRLKDNETEATKLIAQHRCPTCCRKFDRKSAKDMIGTARLRDGLTKKQLEAEMQALKQLEQEKTKLEHGADMYEALAKEHDVLSNGRDVDSLRAVLDDIERRLDGLEASEKPITQARAEIRMDEHEQALEAARKGLAQLKSEGELAQFWVDGLRMKIKSKLLDGVEEYLDERLRHYSSALTAGEITIGFAARTTLKKGTQQDKIAVTAEHLFGAAELDLHSSGERQRIDLAIVLALQDLARQQHGSAVRLSLFDEVFDHLDETGVERLMGLMAQEKAERGTVAIVTQNPRISAHPADHQLVVTRTKEGTTVTYDEEEI